MARKIRIIFTLFFCFTFTYTISAQNLTRHNWLFSDNDQSLLFGKQEGIDPFLDMGKVALNNAGEKLTATHPTSGEVLFYSDGTNIYDASHQIMVRGDGINADVTGIQSMAASPIPGIGNEDRYYLITRDNSGEIFYTIVNMDAQGNRAAGPLLGEVELGERNQAAGITNRGDAMITVASRDMRSFWLITQNSLSGDFEVFSINDLGVFTSESILNLTADVNSLHFAYNNTTARIAVIPSNNVNIQILLFNEATQTLELETAVANSFVLNETFGGSAAWSIEGRVLYFSRNSGADGNVYRYETSDPAASVIPVLPAPVPESLSLLVAPDSSIYHLYRATAGGARILGRLNEPNSSLINVTYELDVMMGQDFGSNYFQQFLPERRIAPVVSFTFQEPCLNNPTLFLPMIEPPEAIPTSYTWDFSGSGQTSQMHAPIVTFDMAGVINASLSVVINGVNYQAPPQMLNLEDNDLEVALMDTTICPGEVLELDAEPQSQGGGGGGGNVTYTYRWNTQETTPQISVTEAGNYWVVVTPSTGCPVYSTAEVTVYGDENPTANIWYFGDGAGIDFNEVDGLDPPPRSIIDPHAMNAPEGTSTISDANGQVLFYTEGDSVFNNLNELMENGATIGGDQGSMQSVIIVPFVDDETLYYVFTTQAVYGTNEYRLKYSVVDMKEGDGLGAVTVKDQILFTKSTEKLAAFEGGNGFWLLSHEYGNNSFRAYLVLAEGIAPPVISSVGSVHSLNDELSGQAGMKFGPAGDRVAVALIDGTDDFLEFFQFDLASGEVTEFEYAIDLNEGDVGINDEVYDVHFSPGGGKIFATMNQRNTGSAGGRVLEYRIDTFSTEATRQASKIDIAQGAGGAVNYGGIQTGPDGQLYVALESSPFVGSIAANDDTLSNSGFNPQAVALTTGTSRLGLPNFVQNSVNPPMPPSMAAPDTTCVEQLVSFSGVGTSDIDEFQWTIQDQTNTVVFSALAQDTSYTFPQGQAGSFEISLNIFNRCGFDTTFVQTLDVFDIPPTPTIPAAVVFCVGQPNLLTAGPVDPILNYVWTDSQGNVVSTANTFDITLQDTYTVTISNVAGCSSTRSVFAGPPFEITLPPNQTICQNEVLTLDPNVAANTYLWTRINPDNTTVGLPSQRTADVDSSVPGVFQYVVSIEDPISPGCFVNDTTAVTINPIPLAVVDAIGNTSCGTTTGSIDLTVTTTGSYTYQLLDNGGALIQQNSNFTGPGPVSLTNLGAGIYSIVFTDNSSGCTNTVNGMEVIDTASDVSIVSSVPIDAACGAATGSITVTLNSAVVYPITYTATSTTDPSLAPISGGAAAPVTVAEFVIPGLPGGTYDIQVTSAGGCTDTDSGIVVNVPTDVDLTLTAPIDVCGASVDLNANVASTTPGVSFTWLDPNGAAVANPNAATLSGIYTVTASAPGFCDVTQNVVVTLTVQPIVVINRIGDICTGQITLEAEVTNPQAGAIYNYLWSTGEQTSQITVNADGNYDVIVRESTVVNCQSAVVVEPVTIPVPLEATLTSTPPCDDGQPITLTANILTGTPTGFAWTFNGNPIAGTSNSIIVNDEGDYRVTINQGLCNIERSIFIRRNGIPEGLLPDEEFYCPTRTDNPILTAGVGFETYVWTLDGVPFPTAGRTLDVQAPGEYVVTMTTALGCVQMDTVNIIESCDPQIVVPNVIIPSGNAPNNQFFAFPNAFVAEFEIFIYTRWGELIYQSNSTSFVWDGTYQGNIVPQGTYPYIIKFTSRFEPQRGTFEQVGGITVVR